MLVYLQLLTLTDLRQSNTMQHNQHKNQTKKKLIKKLILKRTTYTTIWQVKPSLT